MSLFLHLSFFFIVECFQRYRIIEHTWNLIKFFSFFFVFIISIFINKMYDN